MLKWLALSALLAPSPELDGQLTPAACVVYKDGKCLYDSAASAGGGGHGGDATVNIWVVPQGGGGGKGGDLNKPPAGKPAASAPASSAPPPSLRTTVARCKLEIGGSTEVEARQCDFRRDGARISFTAPSANGKYVYTPTVDVQEDGTGIGSLMGGKSSARRSLGVMTRSGACWVSQDESVHFCAWK